MDWSTALRLLKAGRRVSRSGWNGKGMWLTLLKGVRCTIMPPLSEMGLDQTPTAQQIWLEPFIVMRAADGTFIPWLASQTDQLAEDWGVVE